jgi:tetratricopeptide (TPR) repeat protein
VTAAAAHRFFSDAAGSLSRGNVAEALAIATAGLLKFPQYPPLLMIAGVAQLHRGRLDLAEGCLSMAYKLAPDYPDAAYNLGFLLESKGDLVGAIARYQETLALQPRHLPATFNLGNAFKASGDIASAEGCYRQVLDVGPHPEALKNLGILALEADNHIEAEKHFRAGLALSENPDIESYLGFTLLAQERFAEGWQFYEARLKAKPESILPALIDKESWDFNPAGTVLVWTEEGIGDVVMFASVLQNVLDRCERVILAADERLHALFSRSFPANLSLCSDNGDISSGDIDAQVGLASCIGRFRKTVGQFSEASHGYLKADESRVVHLKSKLNQLAAGKPVVGISWSSVNEETGMDRSLALAALVDVLGPRKHFLVNLQYGDITADLAGLGEQVAFLHQEVTVDVTRDLDGLAALIKACDIIVSIDNSTVHLAGALGVQQIILLPKPCSWRWGIDHDVSVFYAKTKLLRQQSRGDWSNLVHLPALLSQTIG